MLKMIEACKRIIEQWEDHDKYRVTDDEIALMEFGEPTEVAIARAFLELVS